MAVLCSQLIITFLEKLSCTSNHASTRECLADHMFPWGYFTLPNIFFICLIFLASVSLLLRIPKTERRCLVCFTQLLSEPVQPVYMEKAVNQEPVWPRLVQLHFSFYSRISAVTFITPCYNDWYISTQGPLSFTPRPPSIGRLSFASHCPLYLHPLFPSLSGRQAKFSSKMAKKRKCSELPVLRLWKTFLINQNGFS
jgi:hypothetical protein